MKVRIIKQGDKTFAYDGEDESSLRQALLHDATAIPGGDVYDITDLDRSDMDADEYLIATEDDGTPVWSGWLGGVTGAPPVDRDALAKLAASWREDAHTLAQQGLPGTLDVAKALRDCATELLDAIGGDR